MAAAKNPDPTKIENKSNIKTVASDSANSPLETESSSPPKTEHSSPHRIENQVEVRSEAKGKELDAVVRVQTLATAVEICSKFNTQQRISALKNLVAAQTRPLPLIQTLSEGIIQEVHTLNLKDLSDILFILGKLRYINEALLSKTCETIKLRLKDNTTPAVVGSSINSLRSLGWRDPDLLNELSLWVEQHMDSFRDPSTFIFSLAILNHRPPNIEDICKLVWEKTLKDPHPVRKVNLVWSMYALDCPFDEVKAKETLKSLFDHNFLRHIGSGPESTAVWIKLSNLNAISESLWGSTDFKIPPNVKSNISTFYKNKQRRPLVENVIKLLFKEDSASNLYATDVSSPSGFPIDLVFALDSNMNAVPLHVTSPGCSRVAVMVHSYHECCHPTNEPNGVRAFEMRLLEGTYKVISVPFTILDEGFARVHAYFDAALRKVVNKRN